MRNLAVVSCRPSNLTNEQQVEYLVSTASGQRGPIDIFINCAGVIYYTLMANVQTDRSDRTVDTNCKGLLRCLGSIVPGILGRGTCLSSPSLPMQEENHSRIRPILGEQVPLRSHASSSSPRDCWYRITGELDPAG